MIVIADRINATAKPVARALADREGEFLRRLIRRQVDAGCDYLDLNVGRPGASVETMIDDMRRLIDFALDACIKPLCLDSGSWRVLAAGAEHLAGRRPLLLNSVNATAKSLANVLPLAVEHRATLIAMAWDEQGVPPTARERTKVCGRIVDALLNAGVTAERMFIDAVVLPIAYEPRAARVTLATLEQLKAEFPGVRTLIGLGNISYGLAERTPIEQAFAAACVQSGVDAMLLDPRNRAVRDVIAAAETLADYPQSF
mgnify:FL=1